MILPGTEEERQQERLKDNSPPLPWGGTSSSLQWDTLPSTWIWLISILNGCCQDTYERHADYIFSFCQQTPSWTWESFFSKSGVCPSRYSLLKTSQSSMSASSQQQYFAQLSTTLLSDLAISFSHGSRKFCSRPCRWDFKRGNNR